MLILQKVLADRFLGWHAPGPLRSGLKDSVPPTGRSQIPQHSTRTATLAATVGRVSVSDDVSTTAAAAVAAATFTTNATTTSVRRATTDHFPPALVPACASDGAAVAAVLADLHDRGDVAAAVAVVWRRPYGDNALLEHLLVALHDELVGARDHGQVVPVVELADDAGAEEEAGTARGEAPTFDIIWVGPEKITHGTFVGDFLFAVEQADLVEGVD